MAEVKINSEDCISEWRTMCNMFKAIVKDDPAPEKVKKELITLKALAENSGLLTPRQREGIFGRCENYINGTYGVNRIKTEYAKSHP